MKRKTLLKVESLGLKISKVVLTVVESRLILPILQVVSLITLVFATFSFLPFLLSGVEKEFPRLLSPEPIRNFEILQLFLCLWGIVLIIYLFKSLIIWLHHTFLKTFRKKSYFEIWNQITVQSFLSIFVSGILLLLGLTYGNVFKGYSYNTNLLETSYRSMNKFETILFYTSIFSLILYLSYSSLLNWIQPFLNGIKNKIQ